MIELLNAPPHPRPSHSRPTRAHPLVAGPLFASLLLTCALGCGSAPAGSSGEASTQTRPDDSGGEAQPSEASAASAEASPEASGTEASGTAETETQAGEAAEPTTDPSAGEPAEPAPTDAGEGYASFDADVRLPPDVIAEVRRIAASRERRTEVFAKVGDSATVSRTFMRCLSRDEHLDLAGRDELRPIIDRVRDARVRGGDPFRRESEAAGVGWNARRVLRGTPSPLASEVRAIDPRFALVMFGGNDIELGRPARYAERMQDVIEHLVGWGVVPVLSTIPGRNDDAEANAQVPAYNETVRELARRFHLPLVDLHRALEPLPQRGLASDGVHPNSPVVDGRAHGCDFTPSGLAFGQNVRNLLNLRMVAHLATLLD